MLPKVCSCSTAMDKEKAATSFFNYDKHLSDWEGRRFSYWSSGGVLDNFRGCSRPPDKRGNSRKPWERIANEETKGAVGSWKDTMHRKWEMLLSWRMLISGPAEIKKASKRGTEKVLKTRYCENQEDSNLQELCLDPKEHPKIRKAESVCFWCWLL